jgi:hypothetical protein
MWAAGELGIVRAGERSLSLVSARYAARQRVEPHCHERPYFCDLLADRSMSSRACAAGSVIYHPAGETHMNRFADRGGHISISR